MADPDKLTQRLALLEGVEFSPADLDAIVKEIEDNQRILAELEEFANDTAWVSHQAQPANRQA